MASLAKPPCDAGVIEGRAKERGGPSPESMGSPAAGKWVLAATILGSSMVFIDGSVVNVALPTIQSDLDATSAQIQWVVESYALFLAALILVGGSLGDHLGRRRIFVVGTVLFALTSIWCGLAPNVGNLIAARAAQGIAGALLTPASLAIISATFADDGERGRAIGTWSGFTAITAAFGPVLGGWLVENLSWRWIFFINVPLAAAVLGIALTRVPESKDLTPGRLDWLGAGLVTVGLGALVFGLIEAPVDGWGDPLVLASLGIGVAGLVGFLL
ncbi:MAG: MFS transporter, partial [Chloroflexota bacterium]|nr:MFS transporter [Chloroflexota bacterium]